jgi:hypothetical protein
MPYHAWLAVLEVLCVNHDVSLDGTKVGFSVEKNRGGSEALILTDFPEFVSPDEVFGAVERTLLRGLLPGVNGMQNLSKRGHARIVLTLNASADIDFLRTRLPAQFEDVVAQSAQRALELYELIRMHTEHIPEYERINPRTISVALTRQQIIYAIAMLQGSSVNDTDKLGVFLGDHAARAIDMLDSALG